MFCRHCGKQIKDEARFCPYCGTEVIQAGRDPEDDDRGNKKNGGDSRKFGSTSGLSSLKEKIGFSSWKYGSSSGQLSIKEIWRSKDLLPLIAAVEVAMLLILIALGARLCHRIVLDDYIEVEFYGFDGNGTAKVSFDWDSLAQNKNHVVSYKKDEWGWSYNIPFSELLEDCTYMYVEPRTGLSNGDQVTVSWDVDTADLDELLRTKMKIVSKPKTFTVSGLEEEKYFDAFAGVSVEFSGTSPNATAAVSVAGDWGNQLTYTLNQTSGLAIGDIVTVTIDEASANSYMLEYGLYPEEMSKEYVVDNIPYYVSSLDEIPSDGMEKLKKQAEDVFMASAATWNSDAQFESLNYLGSYFLYEKPGVSSSKVNMIYMIYNIHAKQFGLAESGSRTETDVNYYWYIGFQNGMVLADGTFTIDYGDYSRPTYNIYGSNSEGFTVITYDYTKSYSWSQEIILSYAGYENLDSMFNNLVVTKIDNYTYESTVSDIPTGSSTSSAVSDSSDSVVIAETRQVEEDETGEYLCSYSSDRLITDADLAAIRASDYGTLPVGRSLEQMIINEIYARHGYQFSTPEIQAYFEQKDWYNSIGSYQSDMDIVAGQFSSIEKQNVDFLSSK